MKRALKYFFAFTVPCILFTCILSMSNIYPFGTQSFLYDDMNIQYIDFFLWLRHTLLSGESLFYSFQKSLGGSMLPLISYYIANPLNLLIVFFKETKVDFFIVLLTAFKIGMCGLTMSIYLSHRFEKLQHHWCLLFSCAYALMSYNIIQSSNIMWLDSVVLLPLLLLGIYQFLHRDRSLLLFLSIVISITLNWYGAYKIILFALCFYLFECLYADKFSWRKSFHLVFVFALGVCGSAFLFLPAIIGQMSSKTSFTLGVLKPSFHNMIFPKYFLWGAKPDTNTLSLFCGTITLIFAILYFLRGNDSRKEKKAGLIFLGFMVLCCLFNPLECIWNGMQKSYSDYCRLAFLPIFLLIFFAAAYCLEKQTTFHKCLYPLCLILLSGELCINGALSFQGIYQTSHTDFASYVKGQNQAIANLKKYDSSWYRTEQTLTRERHTDHTSSFLSESMATKNFMGLAHYSSSFDDCTLTLLNHLGYTKTEEILNYSQPLLASDSLLGLKYILSDTEVIGTKLVTGLSAKNGKNTYCNQNALPLGYAVSTSATDKITADNVFEYQNALFSNFLGHKVTLYTKAAYEQTETTDGISYTISPAVSQNGQPLYGCLENEKDSDIFHRMNVTVNGTYVTHYFDRFSPSAFFIGNASQDSVNVSLSGTRNSLPITNAAFYTLDQSVLNECLRELKKETLTLNTFTNTHVSGEIVVDQDKDLLLTIPNSSGWTVTVNNKTITPETTADCLMTLPVEKGSNQIEMTFQTPGLKAGILVSVISFAVYLVLWLLRIRFCGTKTDEIQ
ncbi:MAG: YfhO family protein [Hespellia sp.]|nr:YfhO family protein [Hespellia sp.]